MSVMDRIALTPGKLYARLSAEFNRLREKRCRTCHVPMVFLAEREGGSTNWAIENAPAVCPVCQPYIETAVEKAARQFDLWDPISPSRRRPGSAH